MKKVILVAGGSRGLGGRIACTLTGDYAVSTCSRTIVEGDSSDFLSVKCNLCKQDDIKRYVDATLDKFGQIDVLIYNAGLMLYDDFTDIKEKDIDMMYEVMVKGFLLLCQEVLPVMKEQGSGYIINISSTRGLTVAPYKVAYSAMKRAVVSLAESILLEYKEYGISVTSVHFGLIDTASSREKYGDELQYLYSVTEIEAVDIISFLLDGHSHIKSLIVGGQL